MSRAIMVPRGMERAITAQAIMRVKLRPDAFRRTGTDWIRHPYQVRPDGEWAIWVLEGGRGSGKTRTGAEEVLQHIEVDHGGPRCFPAGTLMAGRVVGGLKTWYRGQIVQLTTALGRRLSVTPNHPILTPKGFVAAGALREGDNVVCEAQDVPVLTGVHDYQSPTDIEEIFRAMTESTAFTHRTHDAARSDLHGDARFVESHIEVVLPNRLLAGGLYSPHSKFVDEFELVSSDVMLLSLANDGPINERLDGYAATATRSPRLLEQFVGLGALPAVPQCFGVISHVDAALSDVVGEGPAIDMEFLRQLEHGFAGFITTDDLVDVRNNEFAGHVYDLQTEGGWQSANGILASNCHVGIGAPTNGDVRDICFEEESGIMGWQVGAQERFSKYNRQALEAVHNNGARINGYGAEEPARWNGKNFCFVWHDEGSLQNPESITQSLFALRKKYFVSGVEQQPRMLITTTPKPFKHIRELKNQPTTVVTRGTTYDNIENLSEATVNELRRKFEGTTLGRRELMGEDIDDVDGALWLRSWIDDNRVKEAPSLVRVVLAVDPAVTASDTSDDTGIAVAGIGDDGEFYVLHIDGYKLSPNGWAKRAIDLYDQHQADKVLGETNNGGDMVESTLRQAASDARRTVPFKKITSSRGKTVRAEPVAALYEQGRVHHVGSFPKAEDQMCSFPVANEYDDMVDAVVFALSELSGPQRSWRAA